MINLLPPKEKEEILEEKKWKLISILGILFLFFLICLFLILFLINIFISSQLKVQEIFLNQEEKNFQKSEFQVLEEEIITSNQTLLNLNSFYQNQMNFTGILKNISETFPDDIYFTILNFESLEGKISLAGFAPTRESLLELKKNLEEKEFFEEIYFPSSNWVKPIDINFSLSFKIKNDIQK